MTNDLVLDLARAQLAASLMILLVLAVRRPVRGLVGPRIAYGLWLLPLIAAFAVLLPARVSYITVAPAAPSPAVQIIAQTNTPAVVYSAPAPASTPAFTIDPWQAALVLWVLGVVASLGWLAVQQNRYLGFARRGAAGPAAVGFWRPKVVLPVDFEDRFSAQERNLILAHEAMHLRRQDPRVIGLALIARALAWFNPLAYVAVAKLRIDQELACDEAVVSHFPKSRRAYADALAKSQLAIRPLPLGCYWPSPSEHPLLERLAMLKASRIGARSRFAGAGALTLLCAATGLAAWAAEPPVVKIAPAPVSAQGAVDAALGAPGKPVVGETRSVALNSDNSGAAGLQQPTDPDGAAALKATIAAWMADSTLGDADHRAKYLSQALNNPNEVVITDPGLKAIRLNNMMGTLDLFVHAQNWPDQHLAALGRGLSVSLLTSAGSQIDFGSVRLATNPSPGGPDLDSTTFANHVQSYELNGDSITIYSAYLVGGQVIDAPDIQLPISGGSAVVPMPQGGSLAVTLGPSL